MAEQPQNALTSAFPSPPTFYSHFTAVNIDRIAALRSLHKSSKLSEDSSISGSKDSNELPPVIPSNELPEELRYLQPPPPPRDGLYRSFGDLFNLNDTLPTLTEQGIEQLYTPSPSGAASPNSQQSSEPLTHTSKALILKRLAKSLLLNFLEFMGILGTNPEQYQEKLGDLRTLFINFHHLLNEYRPHQAREQVILLMSNEVSRVRSETQNILAMKERVDELMRGLGRSKVDIPDLPPYQNEKDVEQRKEQGYEDAIWEELKMEFGGRRESGAGYFEDDVHWEHDRGWAGGQYPHD